MARAEESTGHLQGRIDRRDGRIRLVLPDDRNLHDSVVERPRDGDEFDVPRESGFVEMCSYVRPRVGGDGLGTALVVVQWNLGEVSRQPREPVAEIPASDRLVRGDGCVRMSPRPDCKVGTLIECVDDVRHRRCGRAAVGVGEGENIGVERFEPGGDSSALSASGVDRVHDSERREGIESVERLCGRRVEFDTYDFGVECLDECLDVRNQTVGVGPIGWHHHPD